MYYYIDDMLGSSRTMVQDGQTSACYEADFYPFGGERDINVSCVQNYKFEGKERDPETQNDDFGARYYSNRFGRWLSADWSSVPEPVPYANLTNPQTLNLYGMVSDNPETFADLDGHDCCQDEIDFAVGIASGAAASITLGAVGAPSPSDSSASHLGQLVGTGIVGAAGELTKDAGVGTAGLGLVAEAPSAGTSTVLVAAGAGTAVAGTAMEGGALANLAKVVGTPMSKSQTPYQRPNNATTNEQRESVQGKPCAKCGATGQKNYADHKDPLVVQHYRDGQVDKDQMHDVDAVQPMCPTCSNQQGGFLSGFSRAMKKLLN